MSTTAIEVPTADVPPGRNGIGWSQQAQLPPVTFREFNRGFFDRSDPLEAAGTNLEQFGFAVSYPVDRGKHSAVLEELYGRVCTRLRARSIPGATLRLVDYKDAGAGAEPSRRYVVIEKETARATHMEIFATFRSYGDFLYISLDSFILPPLDVFRTLRAVLLSFVLLIATTMFLTPLGTLFLAIPWLIWYFRDVIASLGQGDSPAMALRRRYHTRNNFGTFNLDDMLAYLKSTVALAIDGISEVFDAHDIPVDVLNQVRQTINQTTNLVNNGGMMNLLGSVIGGTSNQATTARA